MRKIVTTLNSYGLNFYYAPPYSISWKSRPLYGQEATNICMGMCNRAYGTHAKTATQNMY